MGLFRLVLHFKSEENSSQQVLKKSMCSSNNQQSCSRACMSPICNSTTSSLVVEHVCHLYVIQQPAVVALQLVIFHNSNTLYSKLYFTIRIHFTGSYISQFEYTLQFRFYLIVKR